MEKFVSKEISLFNITDCERKFAGIGKDEDCLEKILGFIKTSKSPITISCNWSWLYTPNSDKAFDINKIGHFVLAPGEGDLVVNIYNEEECDDDYEFPSTCSNWADAESLIIKALEARKKELDNGYPVIGKNVIHSNKTGYNYDLLEGKELNGRATSDICYIMQTKDDVGYTQLIGWFFGCTYDTVKIATEYIKEFEETGKRNINTNLEKVK